MLGTQTNKYFNVKKFPGQCSLPYLLKRIIYTIQTVRYNSVSLDQWNLGKNQMAFHMFLLTQEEGGADSWKLEPKQHTFS